MVMSIGLEEHVSKFRRSDLLSATVQKLGTEAIILQHQFYAATEQMARTADETRGILVT